MNPLRKFENGGWVVRSVVVNNIPWFVGRDVAEALGYENTSKALQMHVDDDDKINVENSTNEVGVQNFSESFGDIFILDSLGRKKYPVLINESGLYSLVLRSKLKTAKQFKHWVTSDVLPAIRQFGLYATDKVKQDYRENPETLRQSMEAMMAKMDNLETSLSKLQKDLQEAGYQIEARDRRLHNGASAIEFTRLYGKSNEALPISYFAQDFGLSPVMMNLVLISFGILREVQNKTGNKHRYALDKWKQFVRQSFRVLDITPKNGRGPVRRQIEINPSSPAWFRAVFPYWVGFFTMYGLLDEKGKFYRDVWERARNEMKRQCQKEGTTLKQAWALDYFKPNKLPYENMLISDRAVLFPECPVPIVVNTDSKR